MHGTFDILETMNNKSPETMSELTYCITAINDGQAQHSPNTARSRLVGGPVVGSRWLANREH